MKPFGSLARVLAQGRPFDSLARALAQGRRRALVALRAQRAQRALRVSLSLLALVGVPLALATQAQVSAPIDREYTLEATMLGYRGVGGDIDGIRNPPLWARSGENVRITIVNGALMVHDVTLEK